MELKSNPSGIIWVEDLKISDAKTKIMADVLETLAPNASVLVLVPEKNEDYETIARSINNLSNAKLLLANYLNIRDLLGYEKLVIPLQALDVINMNLGTSRGAS